MMCCWTRTAARQTVFHQSALACCCYRYSLAIALTLMEFLPNFIKLPTTTTKYLGATVEQKLVNSATASSCTFSTIDRHSGSNNPTQNCLFADLQFHSQLDAETRNCIHQTHLILRFWCF